VEHKLAGKTYPSISRRFAEKYGFEAPSRMHVFCLVKKLKEKYTLLDVRKGKKGRSKTATNARNIRRVERCLDRAATREPGKQAVSSSLGCKSSTVLPTNQLALFRANRNLKKSLSFIQSRVEYSRSYLRNLVVKINFDRSWELCNNSINFSAREMFFNTFPLRIQRGIYEWR